MNKGKINLWNYVIIYLVAFWLFSFGMAIIMHLLHWHADAIIIFLAATFVGAFGIYSEFYKRHKRVFTDQESKFIYWRATGIELVMQYVMGLLLKFMLPPDAPFLIIYLIGCVAITILILLLNLLMFKLARRSTLRQAKRKAKIGLKI
jgi:hypothetical protein